MRRTHKGIIVCAILLLLPLSHAMTRASGFDRLTYFTFSAPVQVPGATLPAGTYEFRLVNADTSASVLRIASLSDKKMSKLFYMNRGIELDRAHDDPIVVLRETAPGVAPALDGWVYPGEETGLTFVYSHRQAEALNAGLGHPATRVAATSSRMIVGSVGNHSLSTRVR